MDAERGISGAGLPAGLASMAPGPGLAAVLASVDRDAVDGDGLLDLVAARSRLIWHLSAELLADLAATVASSVPEPGQDEEQLISDVSDVVGWVLHCSGGYAFGQVHVAMALTRRLPMVLESLRSGRLDPARAAAFADALMFVSDAAARRIAARLLPKAERWTLAELRASLRYHVRKADPGAARRCYQKRVAERDLHLRMKEDGTANLAGRGLAPHRAAAAYDRIDRIARAARAQGDARNLAQLRADAMCDVLAGVPFRLAPTVDPVSAEADARHVPDMDAGLSWPDWRTTESRFPTAKAGGDGGEEWGGPGDAPDGGPDGGGGSHRSGGPEPDPPPDEELAGVIDLYDYDRACLTDEDRAWVEIGCEPPGAGADERLDWWHECRPARTAAESRFPTAKTGAGEPGYREHDPDDHDDLGEPAWPRGEPDPEDRVWAVAQAQALYDRAVLSDDVLAGDRCACGGVLSVRPGVVDVQVKLTTLAGLDDDPAIIPGLGDTLAEVARQLAFDPHTRPAWQWSIFDLDGDLLHHGTTRHRPAPAAGVDSRGAIAKAQRSCTCARVEQAQRRGSVELQLTLADLTAVAAMLPAGRRRCPT